ncbi:peptidoglycan/LPS O-acetylase OafA/YrhL [Flavobacterium sp. 270]|uniref:acyltransferase family protein n=1 Tax=Flavobacterium sp. 270 TaxID=2512114 RepID=UPI001066ADB4|nr:acyltransferase [Flavobacterium sp. 270]TDW47299.1 peptidoglycan/LPS O-acetylase OafA/YrhL [Flavobacterium sp. 270]
MTDNTTSLNLLKSKQHFEILDGLRGLAAIAVVIFHFMEIAISDYNKNFISHGFLAVDFFFCLSGFVITYAYDHRIADMGLLSFIKLRLIRLQPLVIIGSILGLFTLLLDPYSNLYAIYGFKETALFFITSILLIPYPMMPERFFNLFSLNAPVWSLFWEYVANIVYAVVLFKVAKKLLMLLVFLAAISICYVGWHSGNVGGGWGGMNFFDGLARIAFSFLMGMLIYRSNWIIKNKLGLLGMSVLLLIAFLIPYNDHWNWLVEPILIIFYLPLLVSLGAGASLAARHQKINTISGDISYPLYMTHYPFIWIFLTYFVAEKPSAERLWLVIPVSVILLIGFAYLVFQFLDFPIRRYFTNKLKASANR